MTAEVRPEPADPPAFNAPPDLQRATVAIVTTAALHVPEDEGFAPRDQSFRILDGKRRDLRLGHISTNFDRSGLALDLNVMFPIDRLNELAGRGEIGRVADEHLSFLGAQDETMSTIRLDTGPAAAKRLLDAGVQVALLIPI